MSIIRVEGKKNGIIKDAPEKFGAYDCPFCGGFLFSSLCYNCKAEIVAYADDDTYDNYELIQYDGYGNIHYYHYSYFNCIACLRPIEFSLLRTECDFCGQKIGWRKISSSSSSSDYAYYDLISRDNNGNSYLSTKLHHPRAHYLCKCNHAIPFDITIKNCPYCFRKLDWIDSRIINSINLHQSLGQLNKDQLYQNKATYEPFEVTEDYLSNLNTKEYEKIMSDSKVYNIRLQSPFVLTPDMLKKKLGIGHKVLAVELERTKEPTQITSVENAVTEMIKIGYKALAMANHPDLGGDTETMMIVNRAKKEILDLVESLK